MFVKIIRYWLLVAITIAMSGCTPENFKVDGAISGLGTQNLRVMYMRGDALVSRWLPAVDGKFSYTGASPDQTVLEIYTRNMDVVARVVVENGDEVKITGTISEPGGLNIGGNKLNKQWQSWLVEHPDSVREDAIEKYVLENRNSKLAALLLTYNYATPSTFTRAEELMDSLADAAKLPSMGVRISATTDVAHARAAGEKPVYDFKLYSTADSVANFDLKKSAVSLLYFWGEDNAARKETMKKLKELRKEFGDKKVQIADLSAAVDTFTWKMIIKPDSASWRRYWAAGGRMNKAFRNLKVENMPYFVVVDSAGNDRYRGEVQDSALTAAKR